MSNKTVVLTVVDQVITLKVSDICEVVSKVLESPQSIAKEVDNKTPRLSDYETVFARVYLQLYRLDEAAYLPLGEVDIPITRDHFHNVLNESASCGSKWGCFRKLTSFQKWLMLSEEGYIDDYDGQFNDVILNDQIDQLMHDHDALSISSYTELRIWHKVCEAIMEAFESVGIVEFKEE